MAAFFKEVAALPSDCASRYSTYRRPGWAIKESYSTVRHSINPRRPCESRRALIPEFWSGLKPFSHNQGRIFAFIKNFRKESHLQQSNYQFAALLLSYSRNYPSLRRVRPVGSSPFERQNPTRLLSHWLLPALRSSRLGKSSFLSAFPSPLHYHRALGCKASHPVIALHSQLSMFGLETLWVATPTTT